MKDHLIFDTTNATTKADTDSVGAYVRAKDGTLIDSVNINSLDRLSVDATLKNGAGVAVTSSGAAGALDVNITNAITVDLDGIYSGGNTNPDNVGLIAHTRGVTPVDADQIERTTVGLAGLSGVTANTMHGLDVNAALVALNGSGTIDSLKSTTNALWVNVQNTITTSDSALANSTLIATPETGAAATINKAVIASPLTDRKYLWLYNDDNQKMWIGGTSVDVGTGFPISPGSLMELRAGSAVVVKFVSNKASHAIRTMELS